MNPEYTKDLNVKLKLVNSYDKTHGKSFMALNLVMFFESDTKRTGDKITDKLGFIKIKSFWVSKIKRYKK